MTYQDKKRLKAILEFRDPDCKQDLLESLTQGVCNVGTDALVVYDQLRERDTITLYEFLSSVLDELIYGFEELKEVEK